MSSQHDMLERILAKARADLRRRRAAVPLRELERHLDESQSNRDRLITACTRQSKASPLLIAELKRKSPSAGQIDSTTPAAQVAMEYLEAGVDAISVVTDAPSFGGSLADLEVVTGLAHAMDTPVIRKDFITDRYGVAESAVAGVDGMLVLLRALPSNAAAELVSACRVLGMAAVVEVAGAEDLPELERCGADIVLINARDLRDGSVDAHRFARLSGKVRSRVGEIPVVAASGISSGTDAQDASRAGADAILVGTALMRAANRSELISELRAGLQRGAA